MFNSSQLNIITPEKTCLEIRHLTPLIPMKGRFQPSSHVKNVVAQVNRVHSYQFHDPVKFLSLSELNFSFRNVKTISNHLRNFDKPNIIFKFEELAVENKFYDVDIREYMTEEFDIELDFAFPIIAVLTYQKICGVGLEDALAELFSMSVLSTVCEKCVTGVDNPEDKSKAIDYYNVRLVKMANLNALTDSDTDSLIDPHFSIPNDSSTEVSASSIDGSKANSCPAVSRSKTAERCF